MATESLLDRASWSRRSAEFGSLREHFDGRRKFDGRIVVMEFAPSGPVVEGEWARLRDLWLELPVYPNVLDPIDRGDEGKLLLRYAAIDWRRKPIDLQTSPRAPDVAKWGAQLTEVFRRIWNEQPDADASQLLQPLIEIDLAGDLRIGFLPVVLANPRLPPEMHKRRPRCDELTAMHVIGRAVAGLCTGLETPEASAVRSVIERCLQPKPSHRYKMLEDLYAVWAKLANSNFNAQRSWSEAEEGIGWLAVDKPERALDCFNDARRSSTTAFIAEAGRLRACLALGIDPNPPAPPPLPPPLPAKSPLPPVSPVPSAPRRTVTWPEVVDEGLRLERERDFDGALLLYRDVRLDGENDVAINNALARCRLSRGDAGPAIEYARRALEIDPRNVAALAVCARACLLAHKHDEALRWADAWLAVVPDDASGHYSRGRSLFALGRLTAARDAFDRASSLQPHLVEALLLRREADRALKRVRNEVGTPVPLEIEVPEHLAELRDALVAGRVEHVIPVLERSEYDSDGIAKLVHAECLAFARRFEESVEMYERAATLSPELERPALIGKARALLALDRATEALAQLDRARERWPDDMELADVRASVLKRIGNEEDAAHEFGRVVVATNARSDARIGRPRR